MNTEDTNAIKQRVTLENPPPRIWTIPTSLRRRLSSRVGRQRAIADEDHLIMVLYPVPDRKQSRVPGVYFWRSPEGDWAHSEQGSGFAALQSLVQNYEDQVLELEQKQETASTTTEWFEILDAIVPTLRSARNLHETLQNGREQTTDAARRAELQPLCDQTSEIEHAADLLQADVQSSIQYSMARQAERQSDFIREQSVSAHRLNILAAIFLPLATISSAFGMNLPSGLEQMSSAMFWMVILFGMVLGAAIGIFVMQVKGLNPNEW